MHTLLKLISALGRAEQVERTMKQNVVDICIEAICFFVRAALITRSRSSLLLLLQTIDLLADMRFNSVETNGQHEWCIIYNREWIDVNQIMSNKLRKHCVCVCVSRVTLLRSGGRAVTKLIIYVCIYNYPMTHQITSNFCPSVSSCLSFSIHGKLNWAAYIESIENRIFDIDWNAQRNARIQVRTSCYAI